MGLIRFLLALSVVASHTSPIVGLRWLPGNLAVELFFMISGFYMSMILNGKYAEKPVTTFYSNRFLRLYPTYLLLFLATWALFFATWFMLGKMPMTAWREGWSLLNPAYKAWMAVSNFTLVGLDVPTLFHVKVGEGVLWFHSGVENPGDGSTWGYNFLTIGPAWTVGAEVWFYLLAPFLVRRRLSVIVVVLLLSAGLKIWIEVVWHFPTYFIFPAQLCFFLMGVLVERIRNRIPPIAKSLVVISWFALIISLALYPRSLPAHLALVGAFPFLLVLIFRLTCHWEWDRKLGELSYPIYLSHMLVMQVCLLALKTRDGNLVMVLTVAIAALIYFCVDRPIDRFRQRRVAQERQPMEPFLKGVAS